MQQKGRLLFGGIVAMTMLFMVLPAFAEDWPMYMHDNHRSGTTSEQLGLPLLEAWAYNTNRAPQPAWSETPPLYDIWHGLHGDYDSRVLYDLAYHVAVVGDSLYFGISNGDALICLNTADGSERWRFFTNGPVRFAPTVVNDKVYFGSDDGFAYCLNASDGSQVWSYKAETDNRLLFGNSRLISMAPVRTSVLVEGGAAYWAAGVFSQLGTYLCARNADTGGGGWTTTPSRPAQGYLLSANGMLFVPAGKFSPAVYSQSTGSGGSGIGVTGCYALIVDDSSLANGPGYGGDRSYINDPGAKIARVDGNCLIVRDEFSYYCNDEFLIKLARATGVVQWAVPSAYRYSLILADGTLFAGGDDEVAAFSIETGEKLWSGAVNGRACGLAAANRKLYVSTDMGSIHVFGRNPADLDGNGSVGVEDLLIFALEWLECTNPNDDTCHDESQSK